MAVGFITGSSMDGEQFLASFKAIGGAVTGSVGGFVALPVAGQAGFPANSSVIADGGLALSSSFAGVSGSVIQALNFLKANITDANEVSFLEVNQALSEATGSVRLGRVGGTDGVIGGDDFTLGTTDDTDLLNLDANKLSISGTLSASLEIHGAGLRLKNDATIGNTAVSDLVTFNVDGDIVVKDGTHDFDIASHDGSNGLKLGGTLVTATAANLNLNSGVTAGTAAASKVVSLDASQNVAGINNITSKLTNDEATGIVLMNTFSGSTVQLGSSDDTEQQLTIGVSGMSGSDLSITAVGVNASSVGPTGQELQVSGSSFLAGVSDNANNSFSVTYNSNAALSVISSSFGATLGAVSVDSLNCTTSVSGSGPITAQSFKFAGTNGSGVAALYELNVVGGMLQLTSASLG